MSAKSQQPWYLSQTKQQIASKFSEIQQLEDQRLHDALVNHQSSKWRLNSAFKAKNKNRYSNILPYDRSRVVLKDSRITDGYINASNVVVELDDIRQKYIATQGPLKHTTVDFWQMCFGSCDQDDDIVIVMVTPLMEDGHSKCYKYWTDSVGTSIELKSEEFASVLKLTCTASEPVLEGVQYTQLTLLNESTGQVKKVHHLYYSQWADCRKPDNWKAIHDLSRLARSFKTENPLVVHCSAGVGRSGTFIALDFLLMNPRHLASKQEKDAVEHIVHQLRAQRMTMVQTQQQFQFIYAALELFVAQETKRLADEAN